MSITQNQFVDAVQSAVDAPPKAGNKWDNLEALFASTGLRGNGAINNGGGADRTTRARQLATSKEHNGHTTRDVAEHSVYVIGGDSLSSYNSNSSNYIGQVVKSVETEHPTLQTCLIMVASPGSNVTPVHLIKRAGQTPPIPYQTWWPTLGTTDLPAHSAHSSSPAGGVPVAPGPIATNRIFFGPPGTGKSTAVKKLVGANKMVRTQFHPEYSNSDFIGSYRPVVGFELGTSNNIKGHDGTTLTRPVNYFAFVPGPLAQALEVAFTTPEHVYLVIEEINRGDCAAIFGDTFQLLDRDDAGRSEFGITPRSELLAYFSQRGVHYDIAADGRLYLPPNLSILATMNTSDQSLYPMDAAFKRRWHWVACPINFDDLLAHTAPVRPFLDDGTTKWDWIKLLEAINSNIVRERMEDKQVGPWFIKASKDGEISWDEFANKCLFYLWHDVFKDEQHGELSPFLTDGPATFSGVQQIIIEKGLTAAFKPEVLNPIISVAPPQPTESTHAEPAASEATESGS
jgi:hypothetical protein